MSEFQELYEQGLVNEPDLIKYINENATSMDDRVFMFNNEIDIADILNGRIKPYKPIPEIKEMVRRWNKDIGFRVIFEELL